MNLDYIKKEASIQEETDNKENTSNVFNIIMPVITTEKPANQELIKLANKNQEEVEIVRPPKGKDVQLAPIENAVEQADIEVLSRSGGVSVTSTSTPETKKTRVHWLEFGLILGSLGLLGWAIFQKDQKEQKVTTQKKEETKKETVNGVPKKGVKKPQAKKGGSKGKYEIQGFVK
jgi:hypothetical protein